MYAFIIMTDAGCLGAVDFVDPPSGSVIADFEGTLNATTFRCNISHGGIQVGTQWSIENFGGNPSLQTVSNAASDLFEFGGDLRPESTTDTFINRITVLNFTSDLDNAIVYCGTGAQRRQANFMLRIYRKFWMFLATNKFLQLYLKLLYTLHYRFRY